MSEILDKLLDENIIFKQSDVQDGTSCKTRSCYECKICKKVYSYLKYIRQHLNVMHSEDSQHTCNYCGEVFKQKYYLINHKKIHFKGVPKPFKCETCHKEFKRKFLYLDHLQRHSSTNFQCSLCGKTYATSLSLKLHVKLHTREKKHECKLCGRWFYSKHKLQYHMHSHKIKSSMICFLCNKKFKNIKHCLDHEKIHTGNLSSFSCHFCNKVFFSMSVLKKHVNIHSGAKSYVCELCGKSLTTKGSLKNHLKTHSGEKTHICNVCDKTFYTSVTLNIHIKVYHDTARASFKCSLCKKGFMSKTYYEDHLRMHKGIKKFHKCSLCPVSFSHYNSLQRHIKKHLGKGKHKICNSKKEHECEFCGKRFTSAASRKEHLTKHTGKKAYFCGICGKGFRSDYCRKAHENTHTLPFECGICQKRYSSKKSMIIHLKKHEQANQEICLEHSHYENKTNDGQPNDTNEFPSNSYIKWEKLDDSENSKNDQYLLHTDIPVDCLNSIPTNVQDLGQIPAGFSGEVTQLAGLKQEASNCMGNGMKLDATKMTPTGFKTLLPATENSLMVKKVGSFKVNSEDLKKILSGQLVFTELKTGVQNNENN